MAKKTKQNPASALRELVIRSLLIVISVSLALFLDDIRQQQKVTAGLTAAYRSLRSEIETNRSILTKAVENHGKGIATLDSLQRLGATASPNMRARAFPNSLGLPDLQSTAWNTLHATGLVAHLNFDDVYPFSKLYDLQQEGVRQTLMELKKHVWQSESLDNQQNTNTFKDIHLLLDKLYAQEKHLLGEIDAVLSAGQNWRYLE